MHTYTPINMHTYIYINVWILVDLLAAVAFIYIHTLIYMYIYVFIYRKVTRNPAQILREESFPGKEERRRGPLKAVFVSGDATHVLMYVQYVCMYLR